MIYNGDGPDRDPLDALLSRAFAEDASRPPDAHLDHVARMIGHRMAVERSRDARRRTTWLVAAAVLAAAVLAAVVVPGYIEFTRHPRAGAIPPNVNHLVSRQGRLEQLDERWGKIPAEYKRGYKKDDPPGMEAETEKKARAMVANLLARGSGRG